MYSMHSNASEEFVYPDDFFQQGSKAMTERKAEHTRPQAASAPAKAQPIPAKDIAAKVSKPAAARLKAERVDQIDFIIYI